MNNAPIPPALADALREPDPARRFEAARTAGAIAGKAAAARASEEAAAPYEAAATEALEELVAAHGGNVRAAARELPISEQAIHKRRAKTGHGKRRTPAPKAPATQQVQPALAFDNVRGAEDALLDWALRRQEVDDQRDALLLGALAAGVEPARIAELAPAGLDLLRRIRPAGNIQVSRLDQYGTETEEIEEFARAVTARADALLALDTPAGRAAGRIWQYAANQIVTNAAPYALDQGPVVRAADYDTPKAYADALQELADDTDDDGDGGQGPSNFAMVSGADAWLAWYYVQLAREAARDHSTTAGEFVAETGAAFGELAEAILHLRTTGKVPPALTRKTS